jgi:hypothetical protein
MKTMLTARRSRSKGNAGAPGDVLRGPEDEVSLPSGSDDFGRKT